MTTQKERYPDRILKILDHWHADGASSQQCFECSSSCCSYPAFAILENVLLIYDRYKSGLLHREDYEFIKGLSFSEFVETYFQVRYTLTGTWPRRRWLVGFLMKALSADNHLINIPMASGFYRTRAELFRRNPWLSKGCVFLSKKVDPRPDDDHDASRHCILHEPESWTCLTTQPIDCVFYTCTKAWEVKLPPVKLSKRWFRALAVSYPDSVERFHSMTDKQANTRKAE